MKQEASFAAGATRTPLVPQTHIIVLEDLEVLADIGFHAFEVGHAQRLLVTVEVQLDLSCWPVADTREAAWDYDFIRQKIKELVAGRHYNLQERLAEEIFADIARRDGVLGLTVRMRKPDVYPDARSVGIVISSLANARP